MKNEGDHLKLFQTADGSYSILNTQLGETYHSRHGALTESLHVFIGQGFEKTGNTEPLHILEVGYGTGLNAWLTAMACTEAERAVIYTALEPFPPDSELCKKPESYGSSENDIFLWDSIQSSEWNKVTEINSFFQLVKLRTPIELFNHSVGFDLVYFDAFAPGYQPEIWDTAVFRKLFEFMNSPSRLVTYCARGSVKRSMKAAGFIVEPLPGPPGKREMTAALKL